MVLPEFSASRNAEEPADRPALSGMRNVLATARLNTQTAQTAERAFAISGRGIVEYFAASFGEGRQNCVTMGNGFVAGELEDAVDIAAGRNCFITEDLRHA